MNCLAEVAVFKGTIMERPWKKLTFIFISEIYCTKKSREFFLNIVALNGENMYILRGRGARIIAFYII